MVSQISPDLFCLKSTRYDRNITERKIKTAHVLISYRYSDVHHPRNDRSSGHFKAVKESFFRFELQKMNNNVLTLYIPQSTLFSVKTERLICAIRPMIYSRDFYCINVLQGLERLNFLEGISPGLTGAQNWR